MFANPFYCDWFEYATKLGTTFGVLLASLAGILFYKIRSSDRKKNTALKYIALIVLLFLASGGYQASLNYFVIESALLSGKLYYEEAQNRRPVLLFRTAFLLRRFIFHYDQVIQTYDTNISAFSPQWSRIGVMQYVSGRVFGEIPMDQQTYENYFGTKRWDTASPEQVICDGDTAYIAVCSP